MAKSLFILSLILLAALTFGPLPGSLFAQEWPTMSSTSWVAPTEQVQTTLTPFVPTNTPIPTVAPSPIITLQPIDRCVIAKCIYLPVVAR